MSPGGRSLPYRFDAYVPAVALDLHYGSTTGTVDYQVSAIVADLADVIHSVTVSPEYLRSEVLKGRAIHVVGIPYVGVTQCDSSPDSARPGRRHQAHQEGQKPQRGHLGNATCEQQQRDADRE